MLIFSTRQVYRLKISLNQLWSKTLARGKDWNHGAGLHRARIEFSYFAAFAVRENEPLRLKRTLFERRFHRKTVRVVSGFSGSSRGREIRKLRRSGKADRRHGSNLYLLHLSLQSVRSSIPPSSRLLSKSYIFIVNAILFFCTSTLSTLTSTISPTLTTSNGCFTNFLSLN